MNLKLTALSILLLCLQACAVGPQYTKLTDETRKSINKTQLYHLVIQDEVDFTFHQSNATGAMGGGLLMAMIDSSVNKGRAGSAVDIIKPLYDASETVDFREILGKTIYDSLSGVMPLAGPMEPASPVLLVNDQLKEKVYSLQEGEAFLHLYTRYFLTSDFKSLQATTAAQMYTKPAAGGSQKKTSKKSSMPKPVYFNEVIYQSEMIGNGHEESVALWAKDDAALLRAKLLEASRNLADLLITDMQNVADPKCGVKTQATLQINSGASLSPVKGQPLKVAGDRVYLRQAMTNWVYSLLNNQPATETDAEPKGKKKTKKAKKASFPVVACQ